jgi:hypothetical protein
VSNTRGSITLGELVGKVTMLEIACSKRDRRGLLRLDRLIEEHGAGIGLPVLGEMLAGDCPKARTVSNVPTSSACSSSVRSNRSVS